MEDIDFLSISFCDISHQIQIRPEWLIFELYVIVLHGIGRLSNCILKAGFCVLLLRVVVALVSILHEIRNLLG